MFQKQSSQFLQKTIIVRNEYRSTVGKNGLKTHENSNFGVFRIFIFFWYENMTKSFNIAIMLCRIINDLNDVMLVLVLADTMRPKKDFF